MMIVSWYMVLLNYGFKAIEIKNSASPTPFNIDTKPKEIGPPQ